MTRISDRLDDIEEALGEVSKTKKAPKRKTKIFKLPRTLTTGAKKKIKQNYALVFYVRNNGYVDINYAPILNDLVFIKQSGLYHSATADYMMQYISRGKSYPVLIQPEWALTPVKKGEEVTDQQTPFSSKFHAEKTIKEGDQASKQKILIEIVKQSQIIGDQKKKLPGKFLIIGIVAVIVVLYLLNSVLT